MEQSEKLHMQHVHRHPLSFISEHDFKGYCRRCGLRRHFSGFRRDFDESNNCRSCGSRPERCFACLREISGNFYICGHCRADSPLFHQSCAELPQLLQTNFRPHCRFRFKEESDVFFFKRTLEFGCDFCDQSHKGYKYCCDLCNFQIGFGCAATLVQHYRGQEHIVEHFSHRHPLIRLEMDDALCGICRNNIRGPSYGCPPCEFYFHNSCSERPQRVLHPFHAPHGLKLQNTFPGLACNACNKGITSAKHYRCDECDFDLHLRCISLKPKIRCQGDEHLLVLMKSGRRTMPCRACGIEIKLGSYFVLCVECDFKFHVHCGPASPPPIVEHIHHAHFLTLTLPTDSFVKDNFDLFYCDACKEEINLRIPFCCCIECGYYIHWRCAVVEVRPNEALVHFDHNHFLLPLENGTNDDAPCYACGKVPDQDQNRPTYGCDPCRFYLHKTCAQMPWQIQHVLHRHPLTVTTNDGERGRTCDACQKYLHGYIYKCDSCDFVLDFDCAILQLRVVSEGGDPIYAFDEKLNHTAKCRKYKFAISEASFQDCLKCNFILHLMLSPLPQTIEHMSHNQHSLTLMDKHVDGNYGTQICDVCEEERDPQERVYYCKECDYIAEFMCVLEVILALLKKPGDIHLITINSSLSTINSKTSDTISEALTFKDIIEDTMNREEDDTDSEEDSTYRGVINAFKEENRKIRNKISEARHHEATADVSNNSKDFLSDEDFLLLVEDTSSVLTDKLMEQVSWQDLQSELISLGDYKIIPMFVGVLKCLLKKQEDMGDGCFLSQNSKTLVLIYLCATVQSMRCTQVQDITNELLFTWWWHLKAAQLTGFKIDFVFDHLKAVARARYGVDTELYESSPIRYHHEQMSELSQKLDELKAKMAVYTQQTQDIISSIRTDAFRSETEKLSNALQLWRMNAGAGLML